VGPSADGVVVIEDGVKEGEKVITAGQLGLYPQAPVKVISAPEQ